MANVSSSRFGTLLVKNASALSPLVCWFYSVCFQLLCSYIDWLWLLLYMICSFTFLTAYYRGAMGILLVYDVTDESSFNSEFPPSPTLGRWSFLLYTRFLALFADIRNWIRNIEQHASDNVNKILVGNKADMDESKRVWSITRPLSQWLILIITIMVSWFDLRLYLQQRARLLLMSTELSSSKQ